MVLMKERHFAVRRGCTATHSLPWFLSRSNCLAVYRGGTAISGFYHGTVSRRTPGCGVGARAIMRERERECVCVFGERVFGGPGRNKYEKLAFSPCSFHKEEEG